jgi:hypothetical protein
MIFRNIPREGLENLLIYEHPLYFCMLLFTRNSCNLGESGGWFLTVHLSHLECLGILG